MYYTMSSNGEWMAGFMRKLGNMSSTVVELWALKDGLNVAKQLGIDNIVLKWTLNLLYTLFLVPQQSI